MNEYYQLFIRPVFEAWVLLHMEKWTILNQLALLRLHHAVGEVAIGVEASIFV